MKIRIFLLVICTDVLKKNGSVRYKNYKRYTYMTDLDEWFDNGKRKRTQKLFIQSQN